MFKRALVSVSDKQGLVEALRPLQQQGTEIISTGGTAEHLKKNGIPVTPISDVTGFPEVMDGRVRTLHPHVYVPLLARLEVKEDQSLLKEMGIQPIDLVIGNLYPFAEGLKKKLSDEEQIELIDIGGPSLLRAAAKNYRYVTVITDPKDYTLLSKGSSISSDERRTLAGKVFAHTAVYDDMVAAYFKNGMSVKEAESEGLNLAPLEIHQSLRYGENAHQKAIWLKKRGLSGGGLHEAEQLQGKELSYNNLLDLDAAVQSVKLFDRPTAVVIKHSNPCGVASHSDPLQAVKMAFESDPVSFFGGIVALNFSVTAAVADFMKAHFLECIIAPQFGPEAVATLSVKKNLRLLQWPQMMQSKEGQEFRSVLGGGLLQSSDSIDLNENNWTYLQSRPSPDVIKDLHFAWRVCARLKSNAIAVVKNEQTLGLGMGQVNRVDAVEQALQRWKKFHPTQETPVLASDAFFPFADSVEKIAAAGIRWVIQPGGAQRDPEVFQRAQELGISMVITGERHFRH